MFKRTAPVVLSLVVAATGVPVTAAEFDDGITAESVETAGEEAVFEADELTEEAAEAEPVFDAGEDAAEAVFVDAASAQEGTVTVAGTAYSWKKSAADGYTQIGTTGVYYKGTLPTGDYYGTASLTYREFYNGDVTDIAGSQYDTYASATSSKYAILANEDTTVNYEYNADGSIKTTTQVNEKSGQEETTAVIDKDAKGYYYYINGVKNVSVKVSAATYVQAEILEAAGALTGAGTVYTEAAAITLNAAPTTAAAQYKTLNADGTYSATKWNSAAAVTDAKAVVETSSNWGDYVLVVEETSTKNIRRNSREDAGFTVNSNILGVIVKASDGTAVGLRHCYEIWVQPYEVAFSKDCGLQGKTITEIDYIMPDATYAYTFAGAYVKPQIPEATKTAVAASISKGSGQAVITGLAAFTNPKVSVYWTEGSGRTRQTHYLAEETAAAVKDGKASVAISAEPSADITYMVKLTSDNYADMTASVVLKDAEPTPTPTVKPSVTVAKSVINLKLKKTTTLKPVLTGVSGTVTYTSSNKKVATVSTKGKITAKKTGKATITIKCGEASTKVTVYVNEKLTLKKSSASIKVNGKTTIKATSNIKGTVTYTSSNPAVATVSSKGVVKGVKKGAASITVKCNGVSKTFKVTVK